MSPSPSRQQLPGLASFSLIGSSRNQSSHNLTITIDVLFYFIETAPVNYTTEERILYEKFLFSSHYDAVMEAAPPPPRPPPASDRGPDQSDMGEKCILVD